MSNEKSLGVIAAESFQACKGWNEVAKKAQGLDRLQISDAVNKMHRILRSM